MAKTNISESVARHFLNERLNALDIPNLIYELAHNIFDENAIDIECQYNIIENFDEDGEETWYDEMREDFVKSVFERIAEAANE